MIRQANMSQKQLIIWNCRHLQQDQFFSKLINSKKKLPLAKEIANANLGVNINLKCKVLNKKPPFNEEEKLVQYKDFVCLDIQDNNLQSIRECISSNEYLFFIIEDSPEQPTVILRFSDKSENLFSEFQLVNTT